MDNNVNCSNGTSTLVETLNSSQLVCHGCKQPIEDDYRLHVAPDLNWHASCLVCTECQSPLNETHTCVMREGRPYCRNDYVRLFGCLCALCSMHISAADLVMRAQSQVFHLECFRCSLCECRLHPGEQYALSSGKLLCSSHFDSLPLEVPSSRASLDSTNNANNVNNANRPLVSDTTATNPRSKRGSVAEKGPRVRTVLSEHQLQTLRSVYASNPRPDALLKEHLVDVTGLSPRVIRVWFQNKRCKDKKKAIQAESVARQQQQQQSQGQPGQPMQQGKIPPLTPQGPLTPDSMSQISPQSAAVMPAFQYPPASFEATPTRSAVSPIVPFHQSAWGSPPDAIATFEAGPDFSSPMTTEHQHIICSSVASQPNAFAF